MTESSTQAHPRRSHAAQANAKSRWGVILIGGWLATACGGQMLEDDDGQIEGVGGKTTTSTWATGGSGGQTSSFSYGATGTGANTSVTRGGATSSSYASSTWATGGSIFGSTWTSSGSTYGSTSRGGSTYGGSTYGGSTYSSTSKGGSTYGGSSWMSGGYSGSTSWVSGGSTWTSGGYSGATSCDYVDCAPLDPNCKGILYPTGSCCPQCVSYCGPCGSVTCAAGYHLETVAGGCCPSCVQDVISACDTGRQQYATYRELLLATYASFTCKTDADCTTVYEKNRCAIGCGIAVSTAMQVTISSTIEKIADSLCNSCSYPASPPCMYGQAACMGGYCKMSTLLL